MGGREKNECMRGARKEQTGLRVDIRICGFVAFGQPPKPKRKSNFEDVIDPKFH
jgi:hypothetical protein